MQVQRMAHQFVSPMASRLALVVTASMLEHKVDFVTTWLASDRNELDRPAYRSTAHHASSMRLLGSPGFCPGLQTLLEALWSLWACFALPLPLPFVAAGCGGSHALAGSEADPRTRTSSPSETGLRVSLSAASPVQAKRRDLELVGSWDRQFEMALVAPSSVAPLFSLTALLSPAVVASATASSAAAAPEVEKS